MEWKQKVDTNLGITIILVFAALFTIIDFYVVGAHIDGYPFNDFSSNVSDVEENKESFQNGDKVFDLSESDNADVKNEDEKSTDDLIFECTFSEDYCLLLDEDNKKLEYYNWDSEGNWSPKMVINGNTIELGGYRLNHFEFIDDNYLFVSCSSGTGNGRPAYFLIADLNGNIISTFNEESLKHGLHNYYVSFENGKIVYDAEQFDSSVENVCNERLGNTQHGIPSWNDGDIMYAKDVYQYIGNGQVSKISHVEKTFGNYMKELTGYDNCQDVINNIDSWKSKGNDIRKFYN